MGSGTMDNWFGLDPQKDSEEPEAAPEAVDISGQTEYTKKKAKDRKGRSSTILSDTLGKTNTSSSSSMASNKTLLG